MLPERKHLYRRQPYMPNCWLRRLPWRGLLLPYVPNPLSLSSRPVLAYFSPLAAGYQCYRDSANTPSCRAPGGGGPNTDTPTDTPTVTYVPPTTTTTTTPTKGPSTAVLPTTTTTPRIATPSPSPSDSGSDNSDSGTNSGASSSAISVGVNAFLTLFAGVGAFVYLA